MPTSITIDSGLIHWDFKRPGSPQHVITISDLATYSFNVSIGVLRWQTNTLASYFCINKRLNGIPTMLLRPIMHMFLPSSGLLGFHISKLVSFLWISSSAFRIKVKQPNGVQLTKYGEWFFIARLPMLCVWRPSTSFFGGMNYNNFS